MLTDFGDYIHAYLDEFNDYLFETKHSQCTMTPEIDPGQMENKTLCLYALQILCSNKISTIVEHIDLY